MGDSKGIVHNIKWTSLSAIVNSLSKIAQIIVLTRFLPKEDFGIVAIASLFLSFMEIIMDLGFSSAVLNRQNISKEEYSSIYWFNLGLSLILFVILVLIAPLIAIYYNIEELQKVISILAFSIILSSLAILQRTFHQKKLHFRFIAIVEIFASTTMVILSIVLAISGFGIYSLIYSTLYYGFFIASVYLLNSIFKEKNLKIYFSFKQTLPFLKIGIYQVGSSILDYISNQMDIIIISSVYSMKVLGAYSLCKQFIVRVYGFFNPIVTKVLTPILALVQQDLMVLRSKYTQTIEVLVTINLPIFFLMSYTSNYLLSILYGKSYIEYSIIFSIISINYAFNSIGNPLSSLLISTGRTDKGFYWTIYRVLTFVIFLKIGSIFSIQILTFTLLLITILNIYPEVKYIYENLINVNYIQYFALFKKPLFICLALFPLYFLTNIFTNKYIGISVISFLFISIYLVSNVMFNNKVIQTVILLLKLDRISFLKKILKFVIK